METIGIFVAVFLATTVGFYFERDAAKKFNLLTALSESSQLRCAAMVKVMEIPRHDVVVGDGARGSGRRGACRWRTHRLQRPAD